MGKSLRNLIRYLAVGTGVLLLLFLGLVVYPFSDIQVPARPYARLLIEQVHVVDAAHDTILPNRYVLLAGDTIFAVSDRPLAPPDSTTRTVDGRGRFLLPALWDMHVHLNRHYAYTAAAEFVVNGVLHVRDMRGAYNPRDPFATTPQRINRWNQKAAEGLLAPRIHNVTSLAVEGPHPMYDGSPAFFNCADPADARRLVAHFQRQGLDLVKVYNNLPRAAFFALVAEAKQAGMDVAGHKPLTVTTREAAAAGMKSLEHARFLIRDSYRGGEGRREDTELREVMLRQLDTALLDANLEALRAHGTYYTPTHLTRRADAYAGDAAFRARYAAINPILRFLSFEDLDATLQEDTTRRARAVYREFYRKGLEITQRAQEHGVPILAGSDVPEMPGTSLLDELDELARAGLSNAEVIVAGTFNPATYYAAETRYGSVAPGQAADLLLLSGNPLRDLTSLRDPEAIFYRGRLLDRDEIRSLKQQIARRNRSPVMSAKLLWDMLTYMTL